MTRLYILEQKIKTLEIIVETLVEELIDEELIDQDKFDKKLIERINELSKEVKDLSEEDIDSEIALFPFFGKKGEA
tara:strand:- start:26 stop:253 length:228 start_codon:yes stop_codon:yes gene_type:complete